MKELLLSILFSLLGSYTAVALQSIEEIEKYTLKHFLAEEQKDISSHVAGLAKQFSKAYDDVRSEGHFGDLSFEAQSKAFFSIQLTVQYIVLSAAWGVAGDAARDAAQESGLMVASEIAHDVWNAGGADTMKKTMTDAIDAATASTAANTAAYTAAMDVLWQPLDEEQIKKAGRYIYLQCSSALLNFIQNSDTWLKDIIAASFKAHQEGSSDATWQSFQVHVSVLEVLFEEIAGYDRSKKIILPYFAPFVRLWDKISVDPLRSDERSENSEVARSYQRSFIQKLQNYFQIYLEESHKLQKLNL